MSLANIVKSIRRGEVLVPKIKKFLVDEESSMTAEKKAEIARREYKMAKAHFEHRLKVAADSNPKVDKYFHPSSLSGCQTAVFFSRMGAPENEGVPDPTEVARSWACFSNGDMFHFRMQNLLRRMGVLKQREVPVLSDEYEIIGHCDGRLLIEELRYLLELKSINAAGFTRLGNSPKPEHKSQVNLYMGLLAYKRAIIFYEDKDRHAWKEFVVEFDEDLFKESLKKIARIKKACARLEPPSREGLGPTGFPCKWCAYSDVCWDSLKQKAWLKKLKNSK